jgi:hypothetical protein
MIDLRLTPRLNRGTGVGSTPFIKAAFIPHRTSSIAVDKRTNSSAKAKGRSGFLTPRAALKHG